MKIVYASRFPPRPFGAWHLGGLRIRRRKPFKLGSSETVSGCCDACRSQTEPQESRGKRQENNVWNNQEAKGAELESDKAVVEGLR